jgi:hypothetical protein
MMDRGMADRLNKNREKEGDFGNFEMDASTRLAKGKKFTEVV